jgi:peptidoglycan/xylan/chitin deacetylase (PgdA/CDA1 family)
MLSEMYRRTVSLVNREPIVSFTFDDFPRTAYLTGGSILEHYGARGTFYTAYGLMNTCNELGEQFRADDLESLLRNGHELASHTYHHISSRSMNCSEFCQDVEEGRKAIEEITGADASNFAYPFGHLTLRTKRALATALTSARSIIPGFNGPEADLNLLRANCLYGTLDTLGHAEQLIAESLKRRAWLIFYTHDVRDNPSPYGCTPELMERAVSCAVRSGSRVLTIKAALEEAGVRNGISESHTQQCVTA